MSCTSQVMAHSDMGNSISHTGKFAAQIVALEFILECQQGFNGV